MKITTNWINQYLQETRALDQIIETLERVGFPCEASEPLENGDTRLDIEITSNRGDCVSVLGLAREISAADGITLNHPPDDIPLELIDNSSSAAAATSVENEELTLCPYYSARIIKNVKVGPSPDWLRVKVESVGLRSVNNIVDISNFILYELGQPLHTFDYDKLAEKRIVVRLARNGETMVAIDGSNLTLDDSILVIADAKRPVAVAGVMGGLDTEVSESTTNILLEAASFNALSVRNTSRRLKLFSDSSYRFERGIHPATVARAADRAARLIAELGGGTILQGDVVAAAPIPDRLIVSLRPDRCRKIAGSEIQTNEMIVRLASLALEPSLEDSSSTQNADQPINCTIPPHRLDLTREIDLIEEIIRLHGFDQLIPHERINIEVVGPQIEITNRVAVEETLAALGFYEVVTYSFISEKHAKPFLPDGFEPLRVGDDRRKAEPVLRPSIIPSLLECRKRNQDAGHRDARLFEQAACFGKIGGEKRENVNLAMVLDAPDPQLGLRTMHAAVDDVVNSVFGSVDSLIVRPVDIGWYEKDGGAALLIDDAVLGTMGVINQSIQNQHGIQTPVVAAEIGIAQFFSRQPDPVSLSAFSTQPAIQRDISVIIDEEIAWSKIDEIVSQIEMENLESVQFVGAYRGKQIGCAKKSVTIRLTFRTPDRTLRHEEVDPQITAVVDRLAKDAGAVRREG